MIKNFRHIAMILVGILSTLPTFSYDFEVDGLCYNKLSNNQVEVTYKNNEGDSYSGNLSIPSSVTYNGSKYSVTAIGNHAFYKCSRLTGSLTIPGSITSIGSYAFWGCIGFTGSLIIPNSVTSIGTYAFAECSGFTGSLTISNSINKIEDNVFYRCSGFTGSLIIPNSVTSIGRDAFSFCIGFAGSLIIPTSVISIESSAFNYCKHLSIVESWIESPFSIPTDVFQDLASNAVLKVPNGTKIRYELYSGWTKNFSTLVEEGEIINQDEIIYGIEINGLCYDLNKTKKTATVTYKYFERDNYSGSLSIPSSVNYNESTYTVTTIGPYAFYKCSRLTGSLVIPNSIEKIEDHAFWSCDNLSGSLIIPNSVTTIGSGAFGCCLKLSGTLTIPSSVISVGEAAFVYCGFNKLIISSSVSNIGNRAFEDCRNLSIVESWIKSPINIEDDVFLGIMSNAILQVPKGTKSKFESSIGWAKNFSKIVEEGESVNLDEIIYGIEINGLFFNLNMTNKTATVTYKYNNGNSYSGSLSIPSSINYNGSTYTVMAIGPRAFYLCSGLTGSLKIPSSVTSIGNEAFRGCNGFTGSLGIPNSVTSIGNFAFSGCSGFTGSLTIPNSVKTIDQGAFWGCSGFTGSLTIPNSVISINSYAFVNCRGFNGSLTIPNSVTSIGTSAFSGCRGFTGSLTIPSSVKTIAEHAFSDCNGFTGSLTIPNSVISISSHAFQNCSGFNGSLNIPNSVTSIGSFAFYNCIGFTGTLNIPNSVISIEDHAFENCGINGSLIIPSSVRSIGSFAFKKCNRLNMVESAIESPFYITEDVFQNIASNVTLQVPKGTKSKYEAYTGWTKNFSKIEEKESGNQDEVLNGIEINGLCYNLNVKDKTATVTYKNYDGDSYFGSLSIPSSVTYNGSTYNVTAIGSRAFYNCDGLSGSLTIPSSVTSIDESAFQNCRGFTGSLTIPNSVSSIGHYAFDGCSGFTGSLTIPNSVTSIGSHAFQYCRFTGSLIIPNSVLSIFSGAFQYCSGFTGSLIIPNSVLLIGGQAFQYCSGLTDTLVIPSSVTYIGDGAFKDCNYIRMVESWIESPFNIGEDVFHDISANAVLQVPKGTKSKYEAYTGWTKNFSKIVEAGSSTTTYELSITASGNGSVSYDGTTIRNNTSTFTVNEGASATISFNPDNGYTISSVKVNSSDVTSNLSSNKYTISNINRNTSVEVEFQEKIKKFTANGINYTILSYDNNTINLANGNYGIVLEVPATITYQGVTWSVAGIDNNALANNNDLAAIIWEPSVVFTGSISNPNLLLYVKSASYAPATIKNVVVNSTAESIVLTDAASGNNFYCPKEFTARKISYTHNYGMITGIGECRGWETIALPFDVKKIAHSSKGELTPFANWRSGDSKKPFWLMSYGTGGWTNASSINANTPYIISMPNNQDYKAEFKLSGNITFSAENVTVKKSDNLQTGSYNGNSFIPNFIITNNSGYLLLNVNNDYVSYTGDSAEGSTFVANLRPVHPFEAYMTSASKTRSTISINADMTTGIEDMSVLMDDSKGIRIYNLKGQLIKVEQDKAIDDVRGSLPAGVYIVNGKKLIIK